MDGSARTATSSSALRGKSIWVSVALAFAALILAIVVVPTTTTTQAGAKSHTIDEFSSRRSGRGGRSSSRRSGRSRGGRSRYAGGSRGRGSRGSRGGGHRLANRGGRSSRGSNRRTANRGGGRKNGRGSSKNKYASNQSGKNSSRQPWPVAIEQGGTQARQRPIEGYEDRK